MYDIPLPPLPVARFATVCTAALTRSHVYPSSCKVLAISSLSSSSAIPSTNESTIYLSHCVGALSRISSANLTYSTVVRSPCCRASISSKRISSLLDWRQGPFSSSPTGVLRDFRRLRLTTSFLAISYLCMSKARKRCYRAHQ